MGVRDSSFGVNGVVSMASKDFVEAHVEGMHLYAVLLTGSFTDTKRHFYRFGLDGSLDTTFATNGEYIDADTSTSITTTCIGPGGAPAIIGADSAGRRIAWLAPDGSPDTTVNAQARTSLTADNFFSTCVRDATGVVGFKAGTAFRFLSAGGAPDPAFGTNGVLALGGSNIAYAIGVDSKGRIVLGGTAGTGQTLMVARIASGKLDTAFNQTGVATAEVGPLYANAQLAVGKDDKLLQAAFVNTDKPAEMRCVLVRYTEDGALDTSFGGSGKIVYPMDRCRTSQIAVQPDGRILFVGGAKTYRVWN